MQGANGKKQKRDDKRRTLEEPDCFPVDAGLIRTDASEENRFLVYRVRPLRHRALSDG